MSIALTFEKKNMRPLYIAALLVLSFSPAFAKVINGEQSKPLNFEKVGWNKVLILNNGNTALLHFELKKLNLKIYDTKREEIIHREYTTDDFKARWLRDLNFKALFESNGEIVLFVENFINNKHALNRIRFDEEKGAIKEDTVLISNGHGGETNSYYVEKENHSDKYIVFSCRDILHNPDGKLELFKYTAGHKLEVTIPIHISYKNPDVMKLLTLGTTDDDAVYFTIGITGISLSTRYNQYHHQVAIGFLPAGGNAFQTRTIDLPDVVNPLVIQKNATTGNNESYSFNDKFPFVTGQTYDAVNHLLDMIIVDPVMLVGSDGVGNSYLKRACKYILFSVAPTDMSMKGYAIDYKNIEQQTKNKKGAAHSYQAIPSALFAKRGMLTLVSENYAQETTGDLAVSYFNEKNEQVWDTTLDRNKHTGVFTSPEDLFIANNYVYESPMMQYDGIRCYQTDSLIYMFYNGNTEIAPTGEETNKNKSPKYTSSNGYCYVMNEQGQYYNILPFGSLAKDETKAMLMESAAYSADKHTFACLVEDKRGDNTSYHVAWCYLTNFIKE